MTVEQQLEKRKIKPTAMRIVVLDFLLKNKRTVSLKDLETGLESTDRVTLFRTLKTFEDHKIVHSIDDGTGSIKYAVCDDTCDCGYPQDIHVHFHCKVCGETECLPKVKVPPISLPTGYAPQEANIVIKGICHQCTA
jgi:Fur family ferric uptake transcriptional regulator